MAFKRDPGHDGKAVRILELREVEPRVLYVNFSGGINAFGGGVDRACAVISQIQSTVGQFEEYDGARIAVEGFTRGVLQP